MTAEMSSRTSRLASALGMTWVYAPQYEIEGGTHGVAILSRFPLADPHVRQLPYVDQVLAQQRIALYADVVLGDDRLRVVDVHLDTRLGPTDKIRQLHPAVNDAGDRLVVGGDFNTQPWDWADDAVPLTSTEAIAGEQVASAVDDYLGGIGFTGTLPATTPTMRVPVFGMRLDNVYARGPRILAGDVDHVDGSDHWPVWADIDRCAP
jgi:endonuclease/exonuclease/phosphatase family metal-dependent hydrolase